MSFNYKSIWIQLLGAFKKYAWNLYTTTKLKDSLKEPKYDKKLIEFNGIIKNFTNEFSDFFWFLFLFFEKAL